VLLEDHGERVGAELAYRRAAAARRRRCVQSGVLLEEQGKPTDAKLAYQRADLRGHAAACNLGVLLEDHGERVGAELAYRGADARGQPTGAFNLGALLAIRVRGGSQGERTVAAGLERRVAEGSVRLLHERRMPVGRGISTTSRWRRMACT